MEPLPSPSADKRPPVTGPAGPGAPAAGLVVERASLEEWERTVVPWAAAEDWNPGHRDAACFLPTDPDGFLVGRLDGRIVSAISVVVYADRYAFLGHYLVDPRHRHRGLGLATWRAGMPHAGDRTVGLDAVPAQEATYRRSGFRPAHTNVRCTGRPRPGPQPDDLTVPVTAAHLDAIAAYDRQSFPGDRRGFLRRWLTAEGHAARVRLDARGAVTGYGVIRPARAGRRIGPLFADTPEDAAALFDALAALDPGEEICVDVPDNRGEALALAEARGLRPAGRTVRMYNGPLPPARWANTYAVTSLELG